MSERHSKLFSSYADHEGGGQNGNSNEIDRGQV